MRSHEITKFFSMRKCTGSRSVINVAFVIFSCSFGLSSLGEAAEVDTAYSNASLSLVANDAEAGNAEAQFNLGISYYNGDGGPQDFLSAYAWFGVASTQGHEGAMTFRDNIGAQLDPASLAEAREHARDLYKSYVVPFQ